MSKTRVYQIAENLGMSNEDVISKLKELEINVENENSEIENDDVELLVELIGEEAITHDGPTVTITGKLTVQEIANALDVSASEVIMKLMKMGTMASINQEVSEEIASLVVKEYGYTLLTST